MEGIIMLALLACIRGFLALLPTAALVNETIENTSHKLDRPIGHIGHLGDLESHGT